MTTVAASLTEGVMCADSHWTDGDEKGPIRKVYRIHGALVGFAGDVKAIVLVRDWMAAGMEGCAPKACNVSALILTATELNTWTARDGVVPAGAKQYAVGSGGKAARAALSPATMTPKRSGLWPSPSRRTLRTNRACMWT